MNILYLITIFLTFFVFCEATISNSFRQFIREKFDSSVEKRIARDDFAGGRGSFGGGNHKAFKKTK
jgi:hypothetical protein